MREWILFRGSWGQGSPNTAWVKIWDWKTLIARVKIWVWKNPICMGEGMGLENLFAWVKIWDRKPYLLG